MLRIKRLRESLKLNLFLVPTGLIFISFCMILISFNFVIQQYIDKETGKAIDGKFAFLDSWYAEAQTGGVEDDAQFIIPTEYLIFDDQRNLVFPHEPWRSDSEAEYASEIARCFSEDSAISADGKITKVEINDNVYGVAAKKYWGELAVDIVARSDEPASAMYTVLVSANITPMQKFLNALNKTLIILTLVSGLLALFLILNMAKRIDGSFVKLNKYISAVGRREPLPHFKKLPYAEFNSIASAVRDMSDKIDAAEESRKIFFQNASHELRTPLMSIQGYAEGVSTGVLKDPLQAADIILKESNKMSALVDGILLLSKFESINDNLNYEDVDIKELLYDCLWEIKAAADIRGVKIEHRFEIVGERMRADEEWISCALSNMLINAVKYADKLIRILCFADSDVVMIKIMNDGAGIAEEDKPHIFTRFYKGVNGNFGIGLSLAQEIILKHGGEISVSNEDGLTSFTVLLPKHK